MRTSSSARLDSEMHLLTTPARKTAGGQLDVAQSHLREKSTGQSQATARTLRRSPIAEQHPNVRTEQVDGILDYVQTSTTLHPAWILRPHQRPLTTASGPSLFAPAGRLKSRSFKTVVRAPFTSGIQHGSVHCASHLIHCILQARNNRRCSA